SFSRPGEDVRPRHGLRTRAARRDGQGLHHLRRVPTALRALNERRFDTSGRKILSTKPHETARRKTHELSCAFRVVSCGFVDKTCPASYPELTLNESGPCGPRATCAVSVSCDDVGRG